MSMPSDVARRWNLLRLHKRMNAMPSPDATTIPLTIPPTRGAFDLCTDGKGGDVGWEDADPEDVVEGDGRGVDGDGRGEIVDSRDMNVVGAMKRSGLKEMRKVQRSQKPDVLHSGCRKGPGGERNSFAASGELWDNCQVGIVSVRRKKAGCKGRRGSIWWTCSVGLKKCRVVCCRDIGGCDVAQAGRR